MRVVIDDTGLIAALGLDIKPTIQVVDIDDEQVVGCHIGAIAWTGQKHTEETKALLSELRKGVEPVNKGRPSPEAGTDFTIEDDLWELPNTITGSISIWWPAIQAGHVKLFAIAKGVIANPWFALFNAGTNTIEWRQVR